MTFTHPSLAQMDHRPHTYRDQMIAGLIIVAIAGAVALIRFLLS